MSTLQVDLELIRKYNVAAPRYTSYPPATHFAEMPGQEILERMKTHAASDKDLSLYFHLPFCYSLCWYCGCTTVITSNQSASEQYLQYLDRELALLAPLIGRERKVVQLHFGGGTPTFLLPDEIRALGRLIRSHFSLDATIEAGVEIDPRRLTREHVLALREAGFNRASLGVQDFDPRVQLAVHRIQPKIQTEQTVEWLREAGFASLNIDLIYGLPHQTTESFAKTLEEVIAMQPDRLAVFNYAHVPWMKPAQKILKVLPTPEMKLELLKLTVERLTSSGYSYIGMDHFARADDELAIAQRNKTLQRNFQGYSTRGNTDIHAFGMSSISQANGAYWQNHKELPAYYEALDAGQAPISKGYVLTEDDKIRREVIGRLMCDLGLDFGKMTELLGVDFTSYFARELAGLDDLKADGLLETDACELRVTDLGRLLIRNIAVRFDAYFGRETEGRFSKSI
ncbi:MAG: oxygen-independent coproporphyrinogen III oxidase [Verrucomicrobia bacterium]|nr:oxygen-independent coproporphyrinogen III oxidase [Verrucomicrobiota bacterium]